MRGENASTWAGPDEITAVARALDPAFGVAWPHAESVRRRRPPLRASFASSAR